MRILIIEDEQQLAASIRAFLQKEQFNCDIATSAFSAKSALGSNEYDCVLLDIGLPDANGLDIIKILKAQKSDCGIIVVSAKDSLDDKLKGLDLGADDYITKPFHLSELNSRVKSVIRRRKFKGSSEITFSNIRIETDAHKTFINESEVELTPKEFEILLHLVINHHRVISKNSLVSHLWGDYTDVDSFDFLFTHLKNLRKKMEKSNAKAEIKSVYAVGYQIVAV
ncbi:MAG: response regulator transcription factor [Cyclobacteriaceae bacterium]|nr:MAG: response regulator transcription factor [Cyclobacteriaceae bacterium]